MSAETRSSPIQLRNLPGQLFGHQGFISAIILLIALVGFEMFNYSTTLVALEDLLGGLTFAGLKWAAILSIAFCGIDFAGIFRLFMPDDGNQQQKELWFLFGAWLLAATMNAMLTWWGVSMSVSNHTMQSIALVDPTIINTYVPVFVAVMVWVTRILLIGTFSFSGQRFLNKSNQAYLQSPMPVSRRTVRTAYQSTPVFIQQEEAPAQAAAKPAQAHRPMPQQQRAAAVASSPMRNNIRRQEPEYVNDPSYASAQPAYHRLADSGSTDNRTTRKL